MKKVSCLLVTNLADGDFESIVTRLQSIKYYPKNPPLMEIFSTTKHSFSQSFWQTLSCFYKTSLATLSPLTVRLGAWEDYPCYLYEWWSIFQTFQSYDYWLLSNLWKVMPWFKETQDLLLTLVWWVLDK